MVGADGGEQLAMWLVVGGWVRGDGRVGGGDSGNDGWGFIGEC